MNIELNHGQFNKINNGKKKCWTNEGGRYRAWIVDAKDGDWDNEWKNPKKTREDMMIWACDSRHIGKHDWVKIYGNGSKDGTKYKCTYNDTGKH